MSTLQTGEVCGLLGITRETILQKVNRRRLIALPRDGDQVFPAFTILSFLLSQNPEYENKTAIEMLAAADLEPVVVAARVFLKHGA